MAAAAGTAEPPSPAITSGAGLSVATGGAQQTAFLYVQAGPSAAAGTAQVPVPQVTAASTGLPHATGTGQPARPGISPLTRVAGGDGAAQPTAFAYAQAGSPAAAGVAVQPAVEAATTVVKGYGSATVTGPAGTAATVTDPAGTATAVTDPAGTAASTGGAAGAAASVTSPYLARSGVS